MRYFTGYWVFYGYPYFVLKCKNVRHYAAFVWNSCFRKELCPKVKYLLFNPCWNKAQFSPFFTKMCFSLCLPTSGSTQKQPSFWFLKLYTMFGNTMGISSPIRCIKLKGGGHFVTKFAAWHLVALNISTYSEHSVTAESHCIHHSPLKMTANLANVLSKLICLV